MGSRIEVLVQWGVVHELHMAVSETTAIVYSKPTEMKTSPLRPFPYKK